MYFCFNKKPVLTTNNWFVQVVLACKDNDSWSYNPFKPGDACEMVKMITVGSRMNQSLSCYYLLILKYLKPLFKRL